MKHLFIVNPAAGKGKALKLIPEIEKIFENRTGDYTIKITEKPGHATEIAREHVEKEFHRVYSMGGDGTLNEILNGMAGTESELAVIPCGSGNDFIRSILSDLNLDNIIERMVNGTKRIIDLVKVNEKFYANISSIGFDAEVVYNTGKFKKLPLVSGKIAYILGVLYTLLFNKSYRFSINIDDKQFEMKSLLAAVANGRYYGGGMLAAPEAILDDGVFDVFLAEKMTRLQILKFFPKFIKGKHTGIEGVHFYKGKKIRFRSNEPVSLNIDGEVFRTNEAFFEVIPGGLNIVTPAGL